MRFQNYLDACSASPFIDVYGVTGTADMKLIWRYGGAKHEKTQACALDAVKTARLMAGTCSISPGTRVSGR